MKTLSSGIQVDSDTYYKLLEWKDNNMHGHGKFTQPDGNIYEGEQKNNQQNNKGIMKYSNGNIYDGEWNDGKPKSI